MPRRKAQPKQKDKDLLIDLEMTHERILACVPGDVDDPGARKKLQEFRAALLMTFVEQFDAGKDIDRSVLEFLRNVFVDVLAGQPFDLVCALPERYRRKPQEITSPKNEEMVQWVERTWRSNHFKTLKGAADAAAEIWSMEPESVLQELKRSRRKQKSAPASRVKNKMLTLQQLPAEK